MPLSLFVSHRDDPRAEFALTDGLRVGRGPECEVRVASAFLSRVHFSIVATDAGFSVKSHHHGSTSSRQTGPPLGTYLNGERVLGSRALSPGDQLSPSPEPLPQHPVFEVAESVSPMPPGTQLQTTNRGCLASLFGG